MIIYTQWIVGRHGDHGYGKPSDNKPIHFTALCLESKKHPSKDDNAQEVIDFLERKKVSITGITYSFSNRDVKVRFRKSMKVAKEKKLLFPTSEVVEEPLQGGGVKVWTYWRFGDTGWSKEVDACSTYTGDSRVVFDKVRSWHFNEKKICHKCNKKSNVIGLPGESADDEGNFLCWNCYLNFKYPNAEPMPAGWLEEGYLEKAAAQEGAKE